MHNLISLYNQNRKKIWITILTIFLIGMILWRVIYLLDDSSKNRVIINNQTQINTNELNSISMSSDKSAITGRKTLVKQDGIKAIDNFISYCNSGNVQEAYNLISNECKEVMYQEINNFIELYYKPIFANGKRNVSIENWINDTYVVTLNEDALATGSFSEENSFKDYFTIVKDKEGNTKLNINGYIRRTEYNKKNTKNNLEITALRKDVYMDYEVYTFNVKNNSENMARLGNVEDAENVSYLLDDSNFRCEAYVHELTQTQLDIYGKQEKTIQIKYFNDFNSNVYIKKLVFPKVYSYYTSNNYSEIVFEF